MPPRMTPNLTYVSWSTLPTRPTVAARRCISRGASRGARRGRTQSAGPDYAATSGTLNFGVGETTTTVVIPSLPDSLEELPETFTATLSVPTGAGTPGATTTATVTITDVDTTSCQTTLA